MKKKICLYALISLLLLSLLVSCTPTVVIPITTKKPDSGEKTLTASTTPDMSLTTTQTSATTPTDTSATTPTDTSVTTTTTPDLTPTPDVTATPTPIVTPTPTPEENGYILKETADGGLDYQNRIIFLGDSTSYGLKPYKMLPEGNETKQVWYGSVGATIALFNVKTVKLTATNFAEPISIQQALETYKPDILVLKLGINGIKMLDEQAFKEYYGWVINEVFEKSPETKLICQAIYPVKSDNSAQITKKHVEDANKWIKDLVKERYLGGYKCYYLDSYDIFLNSDGYLDPKYENGGDGIHFNEKGYKLALDYIRTHMVPD